MLFQISIDNQNVGLPVTYQEGCIWLENLSTIFPHEVIWLKRVTSTEYWQQVDALMIFPLEKGEIKI